jgi:hypothetical protein
MEYIKSQKNGKLLLCDGYRYRKDKARLNSTSWRYTKTGCKGRLLVTGENYKKATNEHNHGPDPASNEAQIVREKIRKSTVSSEERPRAIIQACSSNNSEEACAQIQSYDAARRTIQRQRNKILARNTTRNKNISEIDINEEYKKTDRGEKFLLYDSGNNDNNRIIMFGTARNIALLNEFPHWCVDGTFKVAP